MKKWMMKERKMSCGGHEEDFQTDKWYTGIGRSSVHNEGVDKEGEQEEEEEERKRRIGIKGGDCD